ncbi:CpsB/CapC family capsule biosynthesis tyrosine phosphatase [uncultured Cetobacterium sp.]|uniref:CpsB/CapC family capsule biosynthesis tyrosine phosphatase n=1 Tax=uncultured Cetobacterium sp. TaxID=527638 RepID=UPI00260ACC43|nr:CpsB/CapC family capsule biosynthesis tyrosine phosphatase [uncultured Cetobacterium sp.]
MVDIHCHVLFGVDDGCKSIESSISLLKEGYELGFRDFILTSHYIYGKYENLNYEKKFLELEKEIKNNNLKINIYRGNEIYLDENIDLVLKNKSFNTLNGSRYVLVEFAPYTLPRVGEVMLKKIIENGYIPILAHVERYEEMKVKDLLRYKELGVKLQINISSVSSLKKSLLKLLYSGRVEFLGSDAHGYGNRNYKLKSYIELLDGVINNENGLIVLNNKEFLNEEGLKDEKEVSNGGFFRSIFRSVFPGDRDRGDIK